MKLFLRLTLLLLLVSFNNDVKIPDIFTGKVIGVKDGDTIEVFFEGKGHIVRLLDIDCPE